MCYKLSNMRYKVCNKNYLADSENYLRDNWAEMRVPRDYDVHFTPCR